MKTRRGGATGRSLPDAMGLLLPTGVCESWSAAVDRAARLLASTWSSQPSTADSDLGTLALTLYTLAHEGGVAAGTVQLDAVRGALNGRTGYRGEPAELRDRIHAVLRDAGHTAADDAISRLRAQLVNQWEPAEPMSDMEPGPSALRGAVERLSRVLDRVSVVESPTAPEPTGPLRVAVAGVVRVVTVRPGSGAMLIVGCAVCKRQAGSVLSVDGGSVTFECPAGHTGTPRILDAVRVRNAVRNVEVFGGGIAGDLSVAGVDMSEDYDPWGRCFLR